MFQFTRPRGARLKVADVGQTVTFGFNSRAHEGRDLPRSVFLSIPPVSIHAPTRGATGGFFAVYGAFAFQFTRPRGARRGAKARNGANACFNSRAHEGRDSPPDMQRRQCFQFQFTRPRGARQIINHATAIKNGFNSRAHEGRDAFHGAATPFASVSIHAPTRGATAKRQICG